VTVRKTRDMYIRRRRVPLAKVYYSISRNFSTGWTSEAGELGVGVTLACGGVEVGGVEVGGVEVGGVVVLPAPCSLEGWLSFERNGRGAGFQMRGLETISTPRRNGRGPESSLKRLWIFT